MTKVGDIVNSRWRLTRELRNDSGQGNTYFAVDQYYPHDNTEYVIKLLKVENPKSLARFEQEIRACLALEHPNIVKVIDSRYQDTLTPFLVTEYCDGGDLSAETIKDRSLLERLRIFELVCAAIAYAHKLPSGAVIHRDIKPGNIFFKAADSMVPIVGDFGLCFFKEDDKSVRPTSTREAVGAWEFRPPEADIGRVESLTESSDVYMLGKLLYWFLSGGVSLVREYYKRQEFDLRGKLDGPMIHFVYDLFDKSIVEKATERYASAIEMLEDVRQLIAFVESRAPYLDARLPQHCVFCRVGRYQFEFDPSIYGGKFAFRRSASYGLRFPLDGHETNVSSYPRILYAICNRCGNVQHFRLDDYLGLQDSWKNLAEPH